MKNLIFLFFVLFFIPVAGIAQLMKGQQYIGGTFSISGNNYKTSDFSTSNISIIPEFGVFLTDKLSLGGGLGYQYNGYNGDNDNIIKGNSVIFGPFVRQHFPIGDQFSVFLEEGAVLSFGTEKTEFSGIETTYNITEFTIGLQPGIIYFPSSKFGLEARFGNVFYTIHREKNKDNDNDEGDDFDTYGINLNVNSISFGFRYYLR